MPDSAHRFRHLGQVQGWYALASSAELRRGAVLSREFLGKPVALFRSASGNAHAVAAHCSHLGTHLGYGTVVGEHIRCPMHHWEYDGGGICRRVPGTDAIPESACQFSYPVAERMGVVFVYNGNEALSEPPRFYSLDEGQMVARRGRTVHLRCPPEAVASNAFDIRHLEAVHDRVLREPPRIERLDAFRLRLTYVSRVTGTTLADRVMRGLSGDHIRVRITAWGAGILTVESDLGRVQSALLLGMWPTEAGTAVTPFAAVRRTGVAAWDACRSRIALWLFEGFLYRDVQILDGIRFRPHLLMPQDEVLGEYLSFIDSLPDFRGAGGGAKPLPASEARLAIPSRQP